MKYISVRDAFVPHPSFPQLCSSCGDAFQATIVDALGALPISLWRQRMGQDESCRYSAWRYLSADTHHGGKTIACSKLHLQTSTQKGHGTPVEVLLQRIMSEHAVQVYKTYGMPLHENHSLCNTRCYQGIPLQLQSQDQILHTSIFSHFVLGTKFWLILLQTGSVQNENETPIWGWPSYRSSFSPNSSSKKSSSSNNLTKTACCSTRCLRRHWLYATKARPPRHSKINTTKTAVRPPWLLGLSAGTLVGPTPPSWASATSEWQISTLTHHSSTVKNSHNIIHSKHSKPPP